MSTVDPSEAERLLEAYCLAITRRDAGLLEACFHSGSVSGLATVAELKRLAALHRVECRQLRFSFVARDSDFTYVRSLQQTRAVGPDTQFRDNLLDSLYALAEEDGRPKIWSSQSLALRFE